MSSPNANPMYSPLPSPPPYVIHSDPAPPTTTVVTVSSPSKAIGSCPVCGGMGWTGTYPIVAWLLCCFCFWNCGLCCCLCMRRKKCTKCGFTVG